MLCYDVQELTKPSSGTAVQQEERLQDLAANLKKPGKAGQLGRCLVQSKSLKLTHVHSLQAYLA